MNKDELTAGFKTDQELHQIVTYEYHTLDVESYKSNALPDFKNSKLLMRLYSHQLIGNKSLSLLRTFVLTTIDVLLTGKILDIIQILLMIQTLLPDIQSRLLIVSLGGNNLLLYMPECLSQFLAILAKIIGE